MGSQAGAAGTAGSVIAGAASAGAESIDMTSTTPDVAPMIDTTRHDDGDRGHFELSRVDGWFIAPLTPLQTG